MKKISNAVVGIGALIGLSISSPSVAQTASTFSRWETIKVTSGSCKLERTGEATVSPTETIELKNMNPKYHYGMFAEGTSKEGDRIFLAYHGEDLVELGIQANAIQGTSTFKLLPSGPTQFQTDLQLVPNGSQTNKELICDLEVQ